MVTESNKTQNEHVELSVDVNIVIADEMGSAESAPPSPHVYPHFSLLHCNSKQQQLHTHDASS